MECLKERNMAECNCSYDGCAKKGLCCECIRYHRNKNALPACYFPPNAEKTYDRSIAHFLRLQKGA